MVDLTPVWKLMNSLLGQKVITIDTYKHKDWETPGIPDRKGNLVYVLPPKEVIEYGLNIQPSEEIVEADPTSKFVQKNLHEARYWLARTINPGYQKDIVVWTDELRLGIIDYLGLEPIELLCKTPQGVPVIRYRYHSHSNYRHYGVRFPEKEETLLQKLEQMGIITPIPISSTEFLKSIFLQ